MPQRCGRACQVNFRRAVDCSAFPTPQVRYALIVLLKHGLATARVDRAPIKEGGAVVSLGTIRYSFVVDAAVLLLRVPRCLVYVQEHLGTAAAILAEQVLHHGVASQEQAIAGAKQAESVTPRNAGEELSQTSFQEGWRALVSARMLTRAEGVPLPPEQVSGTKLAILPPPLLGDALVAPDTDSDDDDELVSKPSTSKSRKGSGGAKAHSALAAARARQATAGTSSRRATAASTAAGGGVPRPGKRTRAEMVSGGALTSAVLEAGDVAGEAPHDLLWRFDFAAVQRLLRHEALSSYVRLKLSPRAQRVVEALLRLSLPFETGSGQSHSKAISARDILAATRLDKGPGGAPAKELTWEQVTKVLEVMAGACGGIVDRHTAGADGGTWSVNFRRVMDDLAEATLMNVLLQQHGVHAPRIVRLLLSKGMMTDQMVADAALVELKTARNTLYHLHSTGILTQQALPKFPNLLPQHTVYLYEASMEAVKAAVLSQTYRVMYNLRVRRHKEAKRQDKLLRAERTAADVDAFEASVGKIRTAIERLDAVLLRMDNMLMSLSHW